MAEASRPNTVWIDPSADIVVTANADAHVYGDDIYADAKAGIGDSGGVGNEPPPQPSAQPGYLSVEAIDALVDSVITEMGGACGIDDAAAADSAEPSDARGLRAARAASAARIDSVWVLCVCGNLL